MNIQIIIAQRGWVFVGEVSQEQGNTVISKAKNVRRWGTTKGLGEIALNGPTQQTVLDEMGTVSLHPLSIVASVQCDPTKWQIFP